MRSAERRRRAGAARLGQTEEAYLLAEQALGIAAPMQIAWIFDTDPGVDSVVDLTDAIASGWLDRTVRRRHVPVARHRWVRATGSARPRLDSDTIDDDAVHAWTVSHSESTPLPVSRGRGWQVASVGTASGRRVVSLIASHVLADGARLVAEAACAASGKPTDPMTDSDPARRRMQCWEDFLDAADQGWAVAGAIARLARTERPTAPNPSDIPAPDAAATEESPRRDRDAAYMSFSIDAARWADIASSHGGTTNSLFAAVVGGIAQRAGVPAGPTAISVAVDRRDADTAEVANTAAGVWIRCTEELGPNAGLTRIRALTKSALATQPAAGGSADDITTVARTLPRPILARAMAALPTPDASVSNLGVAAPELLGVGGVRASEVLVRAATRPLSPRMRRTAVPAVAAWMIGHGDRLAVSICAAHPDRLGVGRDTEALIVDEFARWGLDARPWGAMSPQIGDSDPDLVEKPPNER